MELFEYALLEQLADLLVLLDCLVAFEPLLVSGPHHDHVQPVQPSFQPSQMVPHVQLADPTPLCLTDLLRQRPLLRLRWWKLH